MLFRVFRSEVYKVIKSKVWLALFIGPLFCWFIGNYYTGLSGNEYSWMDIYSRMTGVYGLYLLPLLTGLITAFICRYEHDKNMWKQYLTGPVKRWHVYLMKFLTALGVIGISQAMILSTLYIIQAMHSVSEQIPVEEILISLGSGWIATIPLVAVQLWVTSIWKSFAAPMVINSVLTIPNIVIAGQPDIAIFYPWAQPLLAMVIESGDSSGFAHIDPFMIMTVTFVSGLVFLLGGLTTFSKKVY